MRKILFVIESLHCGGAEKSLITLFQNFDFTHNQVELLLFKEGGEFEKFVPDKVNIRYVSSLKAINPIKLMFLKLKFRFLLFNNSTKKHHTAQLFWKSFGNSIASIDNEYDIAIAYNQGFSTYFVAEKINAKIKYAWLNTDYQKAGYNPKFDFPMYNRYNKIVAVSNENSLSINEEMNSIGKVLPLTVIKDITDVDVVRKMALDGDGLPNEKETISILSVGRLAKAKAFNLAIEACRILVDQKFNIKWYIIGEGSERAYLEQLIKVNSLEEHFILLGYNENPYPFINSCDIYVQTSIFEGLGLSVIEALALGKAVVTTNFPTAHSIVENQITGLICNMDGKSIAQSITRYIQEVELKNKIVNNLSLIENDSKNVSLLKIKQLLESN